MSVSHPSARVSVSGWGVEISDMPDSYLEQVLELEEPPTLEQSVAIMNEAYGKMRTLAKLKSIIEGVDEDDFARAWTACFL